MFCEEKEAKEVGGSKQRTKRMKNMRGRTKQASHFKLRLKRDG